ncbi:MAG TPA: hypothetical protein VFG50_16540 [Rhodothermales bacterium]|nr:hypothetical protein [Rhodothermales bacterium]
MSTLRFELFLEAGQDYESTQYRILSGLQEVRRDFSNNIIYPHLGELVSLHQSLRQMAEQLRTFKEVLPRRIKNVDIDAGEITYEHVGVGSGQVSFIEDIIGWALPNIQSAIEEGRAIFEFVEESLHLEEVGIVPSFVEEGYLLVPDFRGRKLHVLRYDLSIFTQAEERYRTLRTTHVRSVPVGEIIPSPQSIKLDILEYDRSLPNPATYFFDTDLDFPFEQTMLPVAKRKLMRYLYEHGGLA